MFNEDPSLETPRKSDLNDKWNFADGQASSQAEAFRSAIEFAQANIDQDWRWDEDFAKQIDGGLKAWQQFCQQTGFDLRGVFRRRALIPFVLVPRRVAAKHGSAEKLSLLTNLRQAHEAFVFGTPYAALALMRSILETVLRHHYRAEGSDLSERIRKAPLPRGTNVNALHRLRRLSNAILHMDTENDVGLQEMAETKLEAEILRLLYVLRHLIENA